MAAQRADSASVTPAQHPYLAGRTPRAFAHRGWHIGELEGLENSLAAFRRAVEEGYTHVETDVHATADGVLVVHHDATLRRVAGHPGVLRTMPWADLAGVRLRGREPLPRLEEVLEALPDTRFNVDLKAPGTARTDAPSARTGRRGRAGGRRQHGREPPAGRPCAVRRPRRHRGSRAARRCVCAAGP